MRAPPVHRRHLLAAAPLFAALPSAKGSVPLRLVGEVEPPYVMAPGSSTQEGIDVDIARAALQRGGGFDLQLHVVPFRRALAMLGSGDADLMLGLSRTPERERYLLFSQPYGHEVSYQFVRRRGSSPLVRNLGELRTLRVGLVSGFVYPAPLMAALGPERVMATNRSTLFRMLGAGRADVAVMERLNAAWLLKSEGFASQLQIEDFALRGGGSPQMAFSRRSPRAADALAAMNRGLSQLHSGGWDRFEAPYAP